MKKYIAQEKPAENQKIIFKTHDNFNTNEQEGVMHIDENGEETIYIPEQLETEPLDNIAYWKTHPSDYSPEEIQQKFSKLLKELLKEYGAEITLENLGHGAIQEDTIVVNFDFREDLFEKHNTGIIPELILGRYIDGN